MKKRIKQMMKRILAIALAVTMIVPSFGELQAIAQKGREPAVYVPDYLQDGLEWEVKADGGITSSVEVNETGEVAAAAFKGHVFDKHAPIIQDGSFEFTVNMSSAASFGIIYRAQDMDNLNYIAFDYGSQGGRNMVVQSRVSAADKNMELGVIKDMPFNQDVRFRLQFKGQEIALWMEEELVVQTSIDIPLSSGKVGFRVWDGWGKPAPDIIWKDIKVTELLPEEELPEDLKTYEPDYEKPDSFQWDIKLDGGVTSELLAGEDGILTAKAFKGHGIDEKAPSIQDGVIEFTVNLSSAASFAILYRAQDQNNLNYIAFDYGNSGGRYMVAQSRINGKSTDTDLPVVKDMPFGRDVRLKLQYTGNKIKLWMDGELVVSTILNTPLLEGKFGFRIWDGWGKPAPNVTIKDVRMKELGEGIKPPSMEFSPVEIQSDEMKVVMDNRFPSVYEYQLGEQKIDGQKNQLHVVSLNGTEYYVKNPTISEVENSSIVYTLDVMNVENGEPYPQNSDETEVLSSLKIKFIAEGQKLRMHVLEIQDRGDFRTKTISFPGQYFGTVRNSDSHTAAQAQIVTATGGFGGINEKTIELSSQSNQVFNGSYAVINDQSIAVTMENNAIETAQKLMIETGTDEAGKTMTIGNGTFTYRGPGNEEYWQTEELPWSIVSLTGDCNGDGDVNWQDGAVKYRDIALKPYGYEEVKNNISHIFMNCASGASQPFMRQLDTIKTMYNYYDGFGQMILEKGYNGEGHDDVLYDLVGHVNERAGGEEDFKYLLSRAKDYNAKIGVHINVNEYTLDSWFLREEYLYKPLQGAWGYLDQSYRSNSNQEILDGVMDARIKELKETYPDMYWVYVDIFQGVDWYADKMADALNKNGFPTGTEYRGPMEKDMIWVHNSTDIHYPVSHPQETPMYRMMKNSFADIFPPSELLKNIQLPSVGAWEHTTDYNEAIRAFYNNNLAAKYMQHHEIMQMTDTKVVFDKGLTVLKEDNPQVGLGTRVNMYLDDKLIATLPRGNKRPLDGGDPDTYVNSKIFIPWFGEDSETQNPDDADKIYHWNAFNETSTWELPDSWGGQTQVKLYELSNAGRNFVKIVEVQDGSVTLEVKKATPYILMKGEETVLTVKETDNLWGENTLVSEPGFDSGTYENWIQKGDAAVIRLNKRGDSDVRFSGKNGELSQKIEGLIPGNNYTISVWTDVSGNMTANLGVVAGNRRLSDWAGDTSGFVRQERNHKYGYSTYQQLRVNVTVPENTTSLTITLSAGALDNVGEADYVVFDDVRVFQSIRDVKVSPYTFFEDFENVPENFGPFLYATPGNKSIEQVHMVEKNPDLDNPQIKNYVVDGRFSLKLNNNSLSNAKILRTVPSSVRMKSNTTYEMGVDYFTKKSGTYRISVKNDRDQIITDSQMILEAVADGTVGHQSVTFTTDASTQCYVEIYQIGEIGNIETEYLSLDNFYVTDLSSPKNVLQLNKQLSEAETYKLEDYTAGSFVELTKAIAAAKNVLKTTGVNISDGECEAAYDSISQSIQKLIPKSDKSKLQALIREMEELDESAYTPESVKEMKKSLAVAKIVAENDEATEAEVKTAFEGLLKGKEQLKSTSLSEEELLELLEKALEEAEKAKASAEAAQKKAEEERLAAQTAKREAEEAKAAAEAAQNAANENAEAAKEAQKKAEAANAAAEEAQAKAKAASEAAESAKKAAEEAQSKAEITKAEIAQMKEAAEEAHKKAEELLKEAQKPKIGQIYQVGVLKYKITDTNARARSVSVIGSSNKNVKKIIIPSSIIIQEEKYEVTKIGSKAFKNFKKLTNVTIGSGMIEIESYAFHGAVKLKDINVKSTGLKKVGKNAIKGIASKAVIRVPKSRFNAYKKIWKDKGQSKTVKIVK